MSSVVSFSRARKRRYKMKSFRVRVVSLFYLLFIFVVFIFVGFITDWFFYFCNDVLKLFRKFLRSNDIPQFIHKCWDLAKKK